MMWDRRMKQADLAEALGLQQSALSKRLRGERGWSVSELLTVARRLDTSIAYLAGETDDEPSRDPDGNGNRVTREYPCSITQIMHKRLRETDFRPTLVVPSREAS